MDTSKVLFSVRESDREDIGIIAITGLYMPKIRDFDPFGKLWASLRKRFNEWHDIDSAGIFAYDNEQGLILCNFILNNASVVASDAVEYKAKISENTKRFSQRFHAQLSFFEKIVTRFLEDANNGYDDYCRLVEKYNSLAEDDKDGRRACLEEIDRLFDNFLVSVKAKKPKKNKKSDKGPSHVVP